MIEKVEQCELAFRLFPKYSSHSNDSAAGWTWDSNRFFPAFARPVITDTDSSWHMGVIAVRQSKLFSQITRLIFNGSQQYTRTVSARGAIA